MNNQSLFEKYFIRVLDESNTAGGGGVFGGSLQSGEGKGGAFHNTDWYASGDSRTPHSIFSGAIRRPGLKKKRKKKCRSRKNRK